MLTTSNLDDTLGAWSPTPQKVDQAVKAVVETSNPSRVFIFGSWARGEANNASDLDLAVLIPDDRKAELGEIHHSISRQLGDIRMSIDLIVATEGYAAEFISSINSVYYKILHGGRLVYDSGNR